MAARNLSLGEEIFSLYLAHITCGFIRQKTLQEGGPYIIENIYISLQNYFRHFECDCSQCSSPSELGSHTNTLLCTRCTSGKLMQSNPLYYCSPWRCDCGYEKSNHFVTTLVETFMTEIDALSQMERFVSLCFSFY